MIERINLVPRLPLADKIKQLAPVVLIVLVGIICLLTFLEYRVLAGRVSDIEHEFEAMNNQKILSEQLRIKNQQLTGVVNNLREQNNQTAARVSAIEGFQTQKKLFSRALAAIASAMPSSIRCTKITFEGDSGQIAGDAFQYSDLPAFIANLKTDPQFKSVFLKDVDKINKEMDERLTFRIQFNLE